MKTSLLGLAGVALVLSQSGFAAVDPAIACSQISANKGKVLYVCELDSTSDQSKAGTRVSSATLCLGELPAHDTYSEALLAQVTLDGQAQYTGSPMGYYSGNAAEVGTKSDTAYGIDSFRENAYASFDNPYHQYKIDLDRTTLRLNYLQTSDPGVIPLVPSLGWLHYVCKSSHCDGTQKHDFSIKPVDYQFGMTCTAAQ